MKIVLLLLVLASSVQAQTTSFHIWSPTRVLGASTSTWAGTDKLQCTSWIPEIGITNATQIWWFVTAGLGGGGTCTMAIYNATGSTLLGSINAADCSATGIVGGTAAAFSLTAGTKYQVCTCENTNGGTFLATNGNTTTLANALSTTIGSTATNNCLSGIPPTTTGTLNPQIINAPIVLIGTGTPG